jgi:hypothetical protein
MDAAPLNYPLTAQSHPYQVGLLKIAALTTWTRSTYFRCMRCAHICSPKYVDALFFVRGLAIAAQAQSPARAHHWSISTASAVAAARMTPLLSHDPPDEGRVARAASVQWAGWQHLQMLHSPPLP